VEEQIKVTQQTPVLARAVDTAVQPLNLRQ
jgi:hypothetical protein